MWPLAVGVIGVPTAPRYAAIAYLDADAPDLLPLRAGDVPAVNAVRAAHRAHATSPPPSLTACRPGCGGLSTGESARRRPRHRPAGGRRIRRHFPRLDHRR
ncbi:MULTISPECIES: hypothetical protein [Rhodococcus]|uniref:hypothetical protein n=1 Tax=Rhodococcus TaxID=1827 RepID=UPI0002EAD3DF|nr:MULTISPECIES: hypothetical protein [Rhodococcus]QQZ14539.1 hypothetical protein GO592_33890 [Rhodococcus sp. 21391]